MIRWAVQWSKVLLMLTTRIISIPNMNIFDVLSDGNLL